MRRKLALAVLGSIVALAAVLGVLGRSNDAQHSAARTGASAQSEEADGGPQTPADGLRLRALGGRKTVSRAQIQRALQQADAIDTTPGTWEYVGANNIGGRVTDVVVDPTQANTIYISSAGGGVWKSTDAGMTYTPAWPNDYPQAIGSLARGSDGTLWAGTGEANASGGGITYAGDGVYKSTDGGATWTNMGIDNAGMIGRIAVDPVNPNIVFVAAAGDIYSQGGKRGLYRTVDAGAHWTRVLTPDLTLSPWTGVVDVAIDPVNPNRVYATEWDHHRSSYLRPYGGVGSGLYVTDNADATPASDVSWQRIDNTHVSGPLPSYDASQSGLNSDASLGRMGVAIAPSDHTRVYLIVGESLGNDKGFYVSNNGDRSLADGGPTFVASGHAGANPRFEWWFGRLYVDPVNKDHLFKTDVSLRVSSNGGATWGNSGNPHSDQHAMAWDPNVPNRVYLGDDGGMYRSDNNGTSWIHGTSMPWLQAYHVAVSQTRPNRIVMGLQDNGSNKSWANINDAVADPVAASWLSYAGGDGHFVVIDPSDDTFYYGCSQNAGCSGVHDVASTTTTLSAAAAVGATNVKVASVAGLVPGNTLTIDSTGANPETVTMTTVGTQGATGTGVSFTPALAFAHAAAATVVKNGVAGTQSLGFGSRGSGLRCTTDAPLVSDPSTPSTLYIGCNALSRSTNRGANWTTIAPPDLLTGPAPADDSTTNNPLYAGQYPSITAIAPSKSAPSTIYVGTDNGRLWKTTDLGVTWTQFPNPFDPAPPRWVTSIASDPVDSRHAFVSYGGFREGVTAANVFESTSAGSGGGGGSVTWKNISGNLPNAPVNALAYDRPNGTLYAATDLGAFYMQNDDKVWHRLGSNLPNTAMEDVKIQASSQQLYIGTFGRGIWRIPLVAGTPPYDKVADDALVALRSQVSGMGLSAGVTSILTNQIDAIRHSLQSGDDVCGDLTSLESTIAGYVTRGKITSAQQSQLNSSIDSISTELGC